MPETDNRIVMYIDLLGFSALTEAFPYDPTLADAFDMPLMLDIDSIAAFTKNRLIYSFAAFHQSLRSIVDYAKMLYPVTVIAFSDSAFIVTSRLFNAVEIAERLLQSLLPKRVPARIGIAYGSFHALRFRSDMTAKCSDHVASFLGTGVVRSHAAEACGIKGMRILMHPSVLPLLDDPSHNPQRLGSGFFQHLECHIEECNNKAGVRNEINYWQFGRTREDRAWHALQDMWNTAPPDSEIHYLRTAEAIMRMRKARGEQTLTNMRRRTLPRK